jgi:hypothetical protein
MPLMAYSGFNGEATATPANQLTGPPGLLRLKQARRVTAAALQLSEQVTTLRT